MSIVKMISVVFCLSVVTLAHAASEQVHTKILSNGMKVIVKEDHRAPVVASQVWYKVGGRFETKGHTGISHALEHMMFKGTPTYPKGKFSLILADIGGKQNAATGEDYTFYYQEIPVDQLPLVFKLEADRMQNLTLSEAEFAKEIEVVKEERLTRTENDPQGLTRERFNAVAYTNPYRNPVVGWHKDLDNLQASELRMWYQEWYAPNNAILVVVGDVHYQDVFDLAQRNFGKIPARALPAVAPVQKENPTKERDIIVKAPAHVPLLLMGYNVPTLNTDTQQWEPFALYVLSGIMDGGRSARFTKNIVHKMNIATAVDAEYDPYSALESLLFITAVPAPGHTIAELKQAILDQISILQKEFVSASELQRVKIEIRAMNTYEKDEIENQASYLGRFAAVNLPYETPDEILHHIDAVTAEQVQAVAQKYLIPQRLTVAVLEPQSGTKTILSKEVEVAP